MMRSLALVALLITGTFAGPSAAQVQYRPGEMRVHDQPGHVPESEEVPAAFKRQAMFFRTTEPPGTIIVHTS